MVRIEGIGGGGRLGNSGGVEGRTIQKEGFGQAIWVET